MKRNKEIRYFENPEDNAAFMRCVDLLAGLIEKYADRILNDTLYGDYVVDFMGMQMIIEVVPVPYAEEVMKDYCHRACSVNMNEAA
jgi:hypothetical protein